MDSRGGNLDMAIAQFNEGRVDAAMASIDRSLRRNPHDRQAWELKGLFLFAHGNVEPCRQCLESAERAGGLTLAGFVSLADCYWSCGLAQCAAERYRKLAKDAAFIARQDHSAWILGRIATGLVRICEYRAAIDVCMAAAHAQPTSDAVRMLLAQCMARSGYPPALVCGIVQRAIDLKPECFPYRVALATLYGRAGKSDRAYLAVADATHADLSGISCCQCLERLASLYGTFHDDDRRGLCQALASESGDEHDDHYAF